MKVVGRNMLNDTIKQLTEQIAELKNSLPKIEVHYNPRYVSNLYTSAYITSDPGFVYVSFDKDLMTSLNPIQNGAYPFMFRGTIDTYNWEGDWEEVNQSLTEDVSFGSGNDIVKCSFSNSFLQQCEYLQELPIEVYGIVDGVNIYLMMILNHEVFHSLNSAELDIEKGYMQFGFRMRDLFKDPSTMIIGKCNLKPCVPVNTITVDGVEVVPFSAIGNSLANGITLKLVSGNGD